MSTRTLRLVLLTMLAAASAAGCSRQACTAIGAASGVEVALVGVDRTRPITVEACIAERCSQTPVEGSAGTVFVLVEGVDSEQAREVVVSVRTNEGTVLVPPTPATVTPRRVQPNGADCEPTAFVGTATVTGVPAAAATTP